MAGYLLDTNHVSAAIRRVSHLRDRIQRARRQGARFGTCIPVLCEIEAGIQQTARPEAARHTLNRLLRDVRIWPIDRDVAVVWGAVFNEVRLQGRSLSQTDIALVALARSRGLTLLTADRDFEPVSNLRIENWLADPAG
jgi:predicted nucleic acid-binding protein